MRPSDRVWQEGDYTGREWIGALPYRVQMHALLQRLGGFPIIIRLNIFRRLFDWPIGQREASHSWVNTGKIEVFSARRCCPRKVGSGMRSAIFSFDPQKMCLFKSD